MSSRPASRLNRIASAIALLGVAALPSSAFAQATGNVDVDINLQNGITILYYYPAIDVNINLTDLFGTLPPGCTSVADTRACALTPAPAPVTASPVAGELVAAFTINPAALSINAAAVPLVLQNVWAVRAVGGGANTTVTIAAGSSTLLGPNGISNIALGTFNVESPAFGAAGAVGPLPAIAFPDPGLVAARPGNVRTTLNLTGATELGLYSTVAGSNTDTNYTLTVTSS